MIALSFFTYDIHGNRDTLQQDYGSSSFPESQNVMNMHGNRFKRIVYQYDLISGRVNIDACQPATTDQYYHHYEYDAENRITDVETVINMMLLCFYNYIVLS